MKTSKKRKLVEGVGINDADYLIQPKVNGKPKMCPYYRAWVDMLRRCYSPIEHARKPTYTDCSVTPAWHSFMAFRAWMKEQDWEGNHLDKDIISPGNKVYAPGLCCFISPALNTLLNDSGAARGPYPQGVDWRKRNQRFRARLRVDGRHVHLGYFDDKHEAHKVYLLAKTERILKIAREMPEGPVRRGLMLHAALLMVTHISFQTPTKEYLT